MADQALSSAQPRSFKKGRQTRKITGVLVAAIEERLPNPLLEDQLAKAGFRDIETRCIAAPVRLNSAAECVRFEKDSFGALHQMLAGLDETGRSAAWAEIEQKLGELEGPSGFEGPCELIVAVGIK